MDSIRKIDPTDPNIVYAESQDGNLLRRDLRTGEARAIRPLEDNDQAPAVPLPMEFARGDVAAPIRKRCTTAATTCSNPPIAAIPGSTSGPDLTTGIDRE